MKQYSVLYILLVLLWKNIFLSSSDPFSQFSILSKELILKCFPQICLRGKLCSENSQFHSFNPNSNPFRLNHLFKQAGIDYDVRQRLGTKQAATITTLRNKLSCEALISKQRQKPIKIAIVTSWISNNSNSLNITALNQYIYSSKHGYSFLHFSLSVIDWNERHATYNNIKLKDLRNISECRRASPGKTSTDLSSYSRVCHKKEKDTHLPTGWSSVEFVAELLEKYPDIDFFFKTDLDNVFSRLDLLLETLIDPLQQYSLYFTQIENSRFIQSHTWILRNDPYSKRFIKLWLKLANMGLCYSLAHEQGALNILVGRMMKDEWKEKVSEYTCDQMCHSNRNVYKHHHCVLDWYIDNKMSVDDGQTWSHPYIYLYPFFPERKSFVSPSDGFTIQTSKILFDINLTTFQPLLVHPCKRLIYSHPSQIVNQLNDCKE
jgi:hypothetical protein